ncbi:M28 family metallopeptidase [Spirosoma gilvum]
MLAQSDVSAAVVSVELLKKHVFMLASDSLQGRETGTIGQQQASIYCARSFRQSRLLAPFRIDSVQGSFRQTFAFTVGNAVPFGMGRMYGSMSSGSVRAYQSPGSFSRSSYRSIPSTYKPLELAPLPITAKDSNNVSLSHNVGGLLIGTDLKQEVVVLSAHYDHLGKVGKRVYHGADDNASGTATILGVASVFDSLARQGIRPRRSILFLLFSGEEGGLLGSQYFVTNSPIPLNQLICDLNVDMVGRVDNYHHKKPNYCYLINGNQTNELLRMAKQANEQSVHLGLNEGGYDTQSDPNQYFYRSDHYNFVKAGVPALFFSDGEHSDYHQTSDTADKIDYDLLQKRATLVLQTAWLIANEGAK